jgi:hypothetical protein
VGEVPEISRTYTRSDPASEHAEQSRYVPALNVHAGVQKSWMPGRPRTRRAMPWAACPRLAAGRTIELASSSEIQSSERVL